MINQHDIRLTQEILEEDVWQRERERVDIEGNTIVESQEGQLTKRKKGILDC